MNDLPYEMMELAEHAADLKQELDALELENSALTRELDYVADMITKGAKYTALRRWARHRRGSSK